MLALLVLIGCGDSSGRPSEAPVRASIDQLPSPQLTRDGKPPALTHEPPVRTDSACGYQIDAKHLYALSNQRLSKLSDVGRVSPVVVLEDGKPLDAFASTKDFEERCAGAFNFGRNAVRFSPSSQDTAQHDYALTLSDDFPLSTPDGNAWWSYPGTRIDIAFPDDAGLAGQTIELVVTGSTPQGRVKAPPVLKLDAQKITMEEDPSGWMAQLSVPVPSGPWSASLINPPDGPYMLLTSLSLHQGTELRSMLPATTEEGGSVVLTSGSTTDLLQTVQFTTEPPAIIVSGSLTETGAFLGRLEAPSLADLSAPTVRDHIGISYSPLRIFEDNKPLAQPNSSCRKVKQLGKGRYCHSHEVILLSSSDNTAPLSNSRSYTFALSNERRFEGGWWLYPGDAMIARTPHSEVDDKQRLVLVAHPISAGASLSLKLRSTDNVLIEKTFSAAELGAASLTVSLPEEVTSELELEVSTTGHLVLQGVVLERDS